MWRIYAMLEHLKPGKQPCLLGEFSRSKALDVESKSCCKRGKVRAWLELDEAILKITFVRSFDFSRKSRISHCKKK